tara:strand:- start:21648 stop:22841 length:1194 start_codon:yes stop_codon:yes gene_type:complete
MSEQAGSSGATDRVLFLSDRLIRDRGFSLVASAPLADLGKTALEPGARKRIAEAAGVSLSSANNTVGDVLLELMFTQADIEGINVGRPLMPAKRNELEIHFGRKVARKRVDLNRPEFAKVLHMERASYRAAKQNHGIKQANKQLDYLRRKKHRMDFESAKAAFVPSDLRNEAKEESYSTVLYDGFGRNTSNQNIGNADDGGGAWVDVFASKINYSCTTTSPGYVQCTAGVNCRFRHPTALSSVDMVSELTINASSGASTWVCPQVRHDATSTDTWYRGQAGEFTSQGIASFGKRVSGSLTAYVTLGTMGETWAAGDKIAMSVIGSTIVTKYVNASISADWVTKYTETDTAIAGNTQPGFGLRMEAGTNQVDYWTATEDSDGGIVPQVTQAYMRANLC